MVPGEYILTEGSIECNAGRSAIKVAVVNTGVRPIPTWLSLPFFEVNKQMQLDRDKAFGMRLNIAVRTADRFEPGEEKG